MARARRRVLAPRFGVVMVVVPKMLVFHQDSHTRDAFHQFISGVTHRLRLGHTVKLDLRKVELLLPCGVLLLLSSIRGWLTAFPNRLVGNYPEDDVVEQMLQSVGVLERLGLPARKEVNRNEVTRWHFFRGETADASPMQPFMEAAKAKLGEAKQMALYDIIAEAITNVAHHAYDEEVAKKWWMFASFNEDGAYVAVLDGGRSIPGTLLEKPGVADQVRQWVWGRKKSDARILHAAMGGKSRTQLKYRGKGLPEMLESTRQMAGSSLAIYSRHGAFHCASAPDIEERAHHATPLDGTLLLWSLKTARG